MTEENKVVPISSEEKMSEPELAAFADAVKVLESEETVGFILIAFNKDRKVSHKKWISSNQLLIAEKIVTAVSEDALFSPKKGHDTSEPA